MVFEPHAEASEYFSRELTAMVNLRVRGLDDLLARLRAAGIEITGEERNTAAGNFARIHDPEGNPLELWEPPTSPAQGEQA